MAAKARIRATVLISRATAAAIRVVIQGAVSQPVQSIAVMRFLLWQTTSHDPES